MYSQAVADEICARITDGQSLRMVCRDPEMPGLSTAMVWVSEREDFREQYARATDQRADAKFDELDEVSELAANSDSQTQVAGLRLKADNIKWQLARMAPKKYGDKIENTHTGTLTVESIRRLIVDPTTQTLIDK